MKQVETEGETLDQAVARALSLLGVERDQVSLDVLAEGEAGQPGSGQNARVRATVREDPAVVPAAPDEASEDVPAAGAEPAEPEAVEPAPVQAAPVEAEPAEAAPTQAAPRESAPAPAKPRGGEPAAEFADTDEHSAEVRKASVEVLTETLRLMGVEAEVVVRPGNDPSEFILDIQGENTALLIGRRGQTLEALQHVLSRIMADKAGPDGPQPVVDAEDYRGRRVRSLEDMALRLGEKAKRSRKTQEIDALSARDRRIVHMALKDDPWLTTQSSGQGATRRLLIVPKGDRQAREAEPAAGDP